MNILEIQGLKKDFGTHTVLKELSFSVPEGSVFGFLGKNGAGKTTTMKIILGLLRADQGQVQVCGEGVIYGETRTNRHIGYLPDVPEFYGFLRPMEYLKLCGAAAAMNSREILWRGQELLALVGLEKENKKIGGFSRGMKQRLGIAQALLHEPRLLICDEPTSALDPVGRREILEILKQVKARTTVLFSTHILSDVERICDRVAVLNEGTLALNGTLEELKIAGRRDGIRLEFAGQEELTHFLSLPDLGGCRIEKEAVNHQAVLVAPEGDTEALVIRLLAREGMLPVRLEQLEPDLESLFMEVIQ